MFAKVLVLFTLAAAAPQSLDTFKIINGQIQSSAPASAKAVAPAAQAPVAQAAPASAPVASAAAPAAQGNANSGIASQIATSARTIQNDIVNFQQDVSLVKPKADADNIKLQNILNQLSSVIDKDFEEQEIRFRQLETRIENMHREAKGYLDAVRKMTVAQQSIADTIDHFYDESAQLAKAARSYKDAMVRMDEEVRTELDNTYRITVMEPIGKMVGVLPFFNDAIKKRHKKLLDYDRTRTNVKKLVDKPSDNPNKLQAAEAEFAAARNIYEPINHQLITEIPQLINLQVPYLNPSFEALVKSQLAFNEGAFHKLEAIKKSFPPDSDRGLDGRVEAVLQQMRELSICRSN
ncbi:hypothetical protein HDV04_004125 [Boothiomyces sp. JEL0838]|nr:hypothetical protein HDV04_004125 [Boothiomyces sp. JEL0838]